MKWLLLVPCLFALSACSASANSATHTSTKAVAPTATIAPATPTPHFKVGHIIEVGGTWHITVLSVKHASTANEGSQTPKVGKTFLLLTISMLNISAQEQNVAGSVQYTLVAADGTKYMDTPNLDGGQLDGKVEAGLPIKGMLTYDVPTGQPYLLTFENDAMAPGLVIWDIQA